MIWLLAAVAVFIVLAGYVTMPLLRPASSEGMEEGQGEPSRLLARRDLLIRELRELELDHDVGKLAEEDFRSMRSEREAELAEVLRRLSGGETEEE